MRPRDEAKERRILQGTLELIAASGLAELSMEAVARAAGVAIGTLYIYFKNKDALLNALYLDTKRAFARAVFERADLHEPVRPAFERMCIAYLQYVTKNQPAMVFMQQIRNAPMLLDQTREETARASAPLLDLLDRGKAEGLLKDIPTPLMVAFLQSTLAEMAAHVASEPKKAQAARHALVTRLAWDALKA